MEALVVTAAFVAVGAMVLALHFIVDGVLAKRRIRRLDTLIRSGGGEGGSQPSAVRITWQQGGIRLFGRHYPTDRLTALLRGAGVHMSERRFLLFTLAAAGIGMIPVLAVFQSPGASLVSASVAANIPLLLVRHVRNRRENALVRQMPEAIDMIVRSLRAGQAVDQTLREVGRSLDAPLGEEISAIYDEIAMGVPFDAALRKFEGRFAGSSDVKIFCTTFIVQRETGGNLTEILQGLAATVRQRFKLKMQIQAFTAEGRISAIIIGMIPLGFATATYFLNPDYISLLFVHPTGKKVFMAAMVMEGLGFYLMRRLVRIEQ